MKKEIRKLVYYNHEEKLTNDKFQKYKTNNKEFNAKFSATH